MADSTIGSLPKASALDDDSLLLIEQQGTAMALLGALIREFAEAAAGHVKKGDKGDPGDVSTVNGVKPDAKGNVNLTPAAIGAIGQALSMTADCNTELLTGGLKFFVNRITGETINTPNSEGKASSTHGMVLTYTRSTSYGVQLCLLSGTDLIYHRVNHNGTISAWRGLVETITPTENDLPLADGMTANDVMRYFRTGEGVVHVSGRVVGTFTAGATVTIGTLPAGYRPSKNFISPASSAEGVSGVCLITTAGSVRALFPSTATKCAIDATFVAAG